jgi:ABC-type sugar transport system ATPase subunit
MKTILEISNLKKSYKGIVALNNINLSINAGEIHGIVGANGAGKTTLMNILFGNPIIHETGGYQGEIIYQGKTISFKNCKEAIDNGIGMVHQEFALIPDMTVGENIKLGREKTFAFTDRLFGRQFSFIDRKHNDESARQTLKQLGISLDPGIKIFDLSINLRQFVEIAREIDRNNLKLLILDEPTAVLNKNDALKFIEILRGMSKRDIGILFISHRLEEVQNICDRVSVLRDGKLVAQYERGEFSINTLARDMIGHIVTKAAAAKRKIPPRPIISFKHFAVEMPGEEIKDLDLSVYEGEIIGLTSLSGHGKLALGYGMMGIYPIRGEVCYADIKLLKMDAKENILQGIYVLPDDRQDLGQLISELKNHNMYQDSLIIITSARSTSPSDYVPMIIRGPGCRSGVKTSSSIVLDTVATICSFMGVDAPASSIGIPIYDAMTVRQEDREYVYAKWTADLKKERILQFTRYYDMQDELYRTIHQMTAIKEERQNIFEFAGEREKIINSLESRINWQRVLGMGIFLLMLAGYLLEYRWLKKKFTLFQ